MSVFERVQQLHADYTTCKQAFHIAKSEAEAVRSATAGRLQVARNQAAARIVELQSVMEDICRSTTIRALAADELETLRETVYTPTEAEETAFESAVQTAQQAISDAREAKREMRDALTALSADIQAIRAEVLGDSDLDLMPRWIDGEERNFDRLRECRAYE